MSKEDKDKEDKDAKPEDDDKGDGDGGADDKSKGSSGEFEQGDMDRAAGKARIEGRTAGEKAQLEKTLKGLGLIRIDFFSVHPDLSVRARSEYHDPLTLPTSAESL